VKIGLCTRQTMSPPQYMLQDWPLSSAPTTTEQGCGVHGRGVLLTAALCKSPGEEAEGGLRGNSILRSTAEWPQSITPAKHCHMQVLCLSPTLSTVNDPALQRRPQCRDLNQPRHTPGGGPGRM
jgi:hypothetical protein